MLNKIKVNIEKMNWLSIYILKFGLMLSCSLILIAIGLQYTQQSVVHELPINMGRIAISIFTETCIAAVFIDYYAKRHGDEQEN